MTIIKRCEKEVSGSWADKQQQAKTWLAHFVPHYSGRCLPNAEDRCPASHNTADAAKKKMARRRAPARTKSRSLRWRCCSTG